MSNFTYDDYLMHRSHKYIKKIKTGSGKWRYFYKGDTMPGEGPDNSGGPGSEPDSAEDRKMILRSNLMNPGQRSRTRDAMIKAVTNRPSQNKFVGRTASDVDESAYNAPKIKKTSVTNPIKATPLDPSYGAGKTKGKRLSSTFVQKSKEHEHSVKVAEKRERIKNNRATLNKYNSDVVTTKRNKISEAGNNNLSNSQPMRQKRAQDVANVVKKKDSIRNTAKKALTPTSPKKVTSKVGNSVLNTIGTEQTKRANRQAMTSYNPEVSAHNTKKRKETNRSTINSYNPEVEAYNTNKRKETNRQKLNSYNSDVVKTTSSANDTVNKKRFPSATEKIKKLHSIVGKKRSKTTSTPPYRYYSPEGDYRLVYDKKTGKTKRIKTNVQDYKSRPARYHTGRLQPINGTPKEISRKKRKQKSKYSR